MRADALEALAALDAAGSITAAAERRHMTQPALTRQLQALAREVGLDLLERRGRGVSLTPAGQALVALARRQRADWESTLASLRGRAAVPLRLGCGTTIALTLLPAALARLRAEKPQLSVRVHAGDSAATAARLLAGEVDAGLVTTAAADRRLVAAPLLQDPVVAVGPAGTGPERLSRAELAAEALCLYARGTGFRTFLDEWFAGAGWFPEPVAEMDSLEALREMVAAGLGLSLLPRSVVATAVGEGRVRLIQVPELMGVERTIALLRRVDGQHAEFERLLVALAGAAGVLAAGAGVAAGAGAGAVGAP